MDQKIAVVTGASSGIGAATARTLSEAGYHVFCVARRTDRIESLAQEIGGSAVTCDVADPAAVEKLAGAVGGRIDMLVNNAGGALGKDPIRDTDLELWHRMYDSNVMGAARVTQALLPAVVAAEGQIVFVTSVAADTAYEGGGGYCGVKSAEKMLAHTLRLELAGEPVRICEVVPGLVKTAEFSLTRFDGDQERADKEYAGVEGPLVAEDIAECIGWIASRPWHVNIDRLVVRPRAQAAMHKLIRSN